MDSYIPYSSMREIKHEDDFPNGFPHTFSFRSIPFQQQWMGVIHHLSWFIIPMNTIVTSCYISTINHRIQPLTRQLSYLGGPVHSCWTPQQHPRETQLDASCAPSRARERREDKARASRSRAAYVVATSPAGGNHPLVEGKNYSNPCLGKNMEKSHHLLYHIGIKLTLKDRNTWEVIHMQGLTPSIFGGYAMFFSHVKPRNEDRNQPKMEMLNWWPLEILYTLWWTYKKLLKMAIEIVDFPIKNGDFPLLFVCSPEGK